MQLFFFSYTATTEIYTLSLHDALPICRDRKRSDRVGARGKGAGVFVGGLRELQTHRAVSTFLRSEEHTSELQSRENLVCRLLLEKKKHLREQRYVRSEFTASAAGLYGN